MLQVIWRGFRSLAFLDDSDVGVHCVRVGGQLVVRLQLEEVLRPSELGRGAFRAHDGRLRL